MRSYPYSACFREEPKPSPALASLAQESDAFDRDRSSSAECTVLQLVGGDNDSIPFGRNGNGQPAVARQQAGIERLNGVGVDRLSLRSASEQAWHRLRHTRIEPGCGNAEAHRFARAHRLNGQHASTRYRVAGHHNHIQKQLDPVLRHQGARQIPDELGLGVLDKSTRDTLGVPEVDLCTRGARCTECDTAKLQARRRRRCALLDELVCESLGLLVLGLIEHFQTVDDGAGRADQVVAYMRTQECREIESFKRDRAGHRRISPVKANDTVPSRVDRTRPAGRETEHAESADCLHSYASTIGAAKLALTFIVPAFASAGFEGPARNSTSTSGTSNPTTRALNTWCPSDSARRYP